MQVPINSNKQGLPYTPLQFAYSGTIGAKGKDSHSGFIYSHQIQDILLPKLLQHHNPVFYLLFHTPTLYNWIRTVTNNQAKLLDAYIRSSNSPTTNTKLAIELLMKSIEDYVKKWQVVKLSFCHKVYLKRQVKGQLCTHLGKTEVYTHLLQYIPKNKQFTYLPIHCKECQQSFKFECETRQFSQYVVLINPSESFISIGPIKYQIYLMIGDDVVYVKCANKIWYQVNTINQSVRAIGFPQIQMKRIKVAAYSQSMTQSSILKTALPFIQQSVQIQMQVEPQANDDKDMPKMNIQTNPNKKLQSKKATLSELKSKASEIVLKEGSKNYIEEVSKLYIKPKEKDQYEVNYDKGKVKKIKQKKQYIRPNFNLIHQQLKKNGVFQKGTEKLGKKIKKQEKRRKDGSSGED